MDDLKIKLGKRIRKLRTRINLSQEQLAEKIDIAVTNMGKIERGESFVSAPTLEKLANIFGIKFSELFEFDEYISSDEMLKEINLASLPHDKLFKIYKIYKLFVE